MRIVSFAAAAVFLAAAPATAQPRQYTVDEIAADLAYGFCPLFLAGQFPLNSVQLAERGFGAAITKQPHPRVGEMSLVTAKRADGEIAFGGASGKACTVVVSGPKRDAALQRLKDNMSYMGLAFERVANLTPDVPGLNVETFKAPVEGQFLHVQLIQAEGPTPMVSAQLFATDK